LFYSFLAHFI